MKPVLIALALVLVASQVLAKTRCHSSVTGKFVSAKYARENPTTTFCTPLPRPKPAHLRHG